MERYSNCSVRVNKDFVKRRVIYIYGSVENYCKKANISRFRFWKIINNPHVSKDVKCLQTLAKLLDLSIDEILM